MPRKIRGKTTAKGTLTGDNIRKPPIRWRKRDLELIEREITNFNKRLYRQQKKNRGDIILPERQTKTKAVASIKTRAEFNRFIDDLRRFNAQTAKAVKLADGTTVTQWRMDRVKRYQDEGNKEYQGVIDFINESEVFQAGKGTGTIKKYAFGSVKEVVSRPIERDTEKMKMDEFLSYERYVEMRLTANYKLEKQKKMMENYIRGLARANFPDELIEFISRVPPQEFLKIIETDVTAQFSFIYDPIELSKKAEQIKLAFEPYVTDNSFFTYDEVFEIKKDVKAKTDMGYYGRAYDNAHRKYHWKKRKK